MCKNLSSIVLLFFITVANALSVNINLGRDINLNRNRSFDPFFTFITHSVSPIFIVILGSLLLLSWIRNEKVVQKKSIYIVISIPS